MAGAFLFKRAAVVNVFCARYDKRTRSTPTAWRRFTGGLPVCEAGIMGAVCVGEGETHPPTLLPEVAHRLVNEENGLAGGRAYFAALGKEKHVAAIESDAGAAAPIGFTTTLKGDALSALAGVLEVWNTPLRRM